MGTFPPPRPLRHPSSLARSFRQPRTIMIVTATDLSPLVALIAGILILLIPRLLNFIVAIYLIFVGFIGLNNVHHWVNFH
jgi:Protein of unknown function (DUF3096)